MYNNVSLEASQFEYGPDNLTLYVLNFSEER